MFIVNSTILCDSKHVNNVPAGTLFAELHLQDCPVYRLAVNLVGKLLQFPVRCLDDLRRVCMLCE